MVLGVEEGPHGLFPSVEASSSEEAVEIAREHYEAKGSEDLVVFDALDRADLEHMLSVIDDPPDLVRLPNGKIGGNMASEEEDGE